MNDDPDRAVKWSNGSGIRDQVPERPNRREPRAVKRRPKAFPLLNKPRDQFQEITHRNRYWKSNPRKSYA